MKFDYLSDELSLKNFGEKSHLSEMVHFCNKLAPKKIKCPDEKIYFKIKRLFFFSKG